MARILLIDDSPSVVAQLSQWLRSAGHEVLAVVSSPSAARLLRAEAFDLLITDIYMPEIDGIELLRIASQVRKDMPCIAMSSAGGNMNLLSVAKVLGATITMAKPMKRELLLSTVARILMVPSQKQDCTASKI